MAPLGSGTRTDSFRFKMFATVIWFCSSFAIRMLLVVTLQIISTLFLQSLAEVTTLSECPSECSCSPSPPQCPSGVSWVMDHCGCCKICARQFNEDCSATNPCDHIKGLQCHLGAGGDPERGLCRAEAHGMPCSFNGHVYQHGEDFQHVCQHECTCMNGVVGCMPLCPYQMPLPRWRCLRPRLARPKGGCCEEWLCDDNNHISEDLKEQPTGAFQPEGHPHFNHINALLQAKPQHPADGGGTKFREVVSLQMSQVFLEPHCSLQTTEWTPCSATCGMGISSRVTNNNPDCRLVRESRLCQIQQCGFQLPVVRKGKKCQRTVRPEEAVRVTFAGCATAQRYRPRTCGGCIDGRCCTPSSTRTVSLRFKCPDGESFYNIMWIQSCRCSRSCFPYSGLIMGPSVSLYNDIHTFRD